MTFTTHNIHIVQRLQLCVRSYGFFIYYTVCKKIIIIIGLVNLAVTVYVRPGCDYASRFLDKCVQKFS